MAKTAGEYKVPFDAKGNLMHYPTATGMEWRDNEPFLASLHISGMRTGRSAKYLVWEDEEGRTYPMFVADLVDLMERQCVLFGYAVDAVGDRATSPLPWVVRKRGQNYGVALAPDGTTVE